MLDFFRELDSSGDGRVNKKEWRTAMTRLGLELPQKDVDAIFAEFDQDGDGEVSFEELKASLAGKRMAGAGASGGAAKSSAPPKTTKRAEQKVSVLGKGFNLDEGPDALPIQVQISTALKANSGKGTCAARVTSHLLTQPHYVSPVRHDISC